MLHFCSFHRNIDFATFSFSNLNLKVCISMEHAILVFSYEWHLVFYGMGIVQAIFDKSTVQPYGSLSSVDRSPGYSRRCLYTLHVHTVPDHSGLEPVDSLELFVLMLYQCVCSTRILQSVILQTKG